jgi:hypothetical protein
MRHYLTLPEVEVALNRGKQIEQFLGGYLAHGDPAIRYAIIRREDEKIVVTVYESLEPLHPNFYDVVEFSNVEPDTDPEDQYFDTLEDAISFLIYDRGAAVDKFVNQGMVCDEYKDYRHDKNN